MASAGRGIQPAIAGPSADRSSWPRIGPDGQRAIVVAIGILCCVAIGAAIAFAPIFAFAGAAGLAIVAFLLLSGRVDRIFLVVLAGLLAGYTLLGRGLAHVGIPPLFLGEMVLFVGVVAILANLRRARMEPAMVVLVAFMAWGAFRTIPYLGTFGVDALRDAAAWGYGLFAIAVWLIVRRDHLPTLVRAYRALIPILLIWIPIAAVVAIRFGDTIPAGPGSDIPIIVFKSGDFGVHLAGVAAFVLVGLWGERDGLARAGDALLWIGWALAVGLVAAINRGAMAAAAMGAVAILFVRSRTRTMTAAFAMLMLAAVLGLINPVVDLGIERKVSIDQIIENIGSITSDNNDPILDDSKLWRERWWQAIVDYTFNGPYFWLGKGYGINLADDDGFQVLDDNSLRAPNNGHLQFLARGGVPSLVLWVSLQVAFALTVLAAIRRAARLEDWLARRVLIVSLVYWLAALVNGAVDVYLEGPQGGIVFWSNIGLGLAIAGHLRAAERAKERAAELDKRDNPDARRVPATRAPVPVRPGAGAGG